MKFVDTHYRYA